MSVDVAHVVSLVARVLGELEQLVRQRHAERRLRADLNGVITAEGLEAAREDGYAHVADNAVVALAEAVEGLVGGDVRVHERRHLLGACGREHGVVHHHVLVSEVAVQVDVDVAQHRQRYVVLLVAEGGVHVVAELIVVSEVGRVEPLRRCSAGSRKHKGDGRVSYMCQFHFH